MFTFLKHLFQLILSPGHGWEDIEASRIDYRALASGAFYPLTALTALTEFVQRFYHEAPIAELLMNAIISFVMFFLGYFAATFILSLFLPPITDGRYSEQRAHSFVIYSLSLLELIAIIGNCVPVSLSIVIFLPLYVAIIIWKGHTYMNIRQGANGKFAAVSICGILIPPYLLMMLLSLILPSA